jgi:hypothetical protein
MWIKVNMYQWVKGFPKNLFERIGRILEMEGTAVLLWQGSKEKFFVHGKTLPIADTTQVTEAELERLAPESLENFPQKNTFCIED